MGSEMCIRDRISTVSAVCGLWFNFSGLIVGVAVGIGVAVGVLTITGIVFFEPSAEFSRSSCDPGLEQLTNKINIVITKKTDDKYILIIL